MSKLRPLPLLPDMRLSVTTLLAGAATSLAFPPQGLWYLAPLSGAATTHAALAAAHPRDAFLAGGACGIGLYVPTLWWLFSGIDPSAAPVLAYGAPLAVMLAFAAAPALVAYLACRARRAGVGPLMFAGMLIPGMWTLAEWLRHFTAFRFPWAHIGYSQVPDSPLAVLAPVTGVLGLSAATVLAGSLLIMLLRPVEGASRKCAFAALVALGVLTGASATLRWTRPTGEPVSVALFQGAFHMGEKFSSGAVIEALEAYGVAARDSTARVAIVPETALPVLESQLPDNYLAGLHRIAGSEGRDVLLSFFRDTGGNQAGHFSSARVLGSSGIQNRDKRILVPFGEYVPASRWLRPIYERIAAVPMLDTVPGAEDQGSIVLGGARVALKLCFEDLFAHRLRGEVAEARFIIVLANDGWHGSTVPMHQHFQITQTRAAEAAKPVVRVANTGWSGLIDADGRAVETAPPGRPAMLEVTVHPRAGVTPYIRYGDSIPIGIAALAVGISLLRIGRDRDRCGSPVAAWEAS